MTDKQSVYYKCKDCVTEDTKCNVTSLTCNYCLFERNCVENGKCWLEAKSNYYKCACDKGFELHNFRCVKSPQKSLYIVNKINSLSITKITSNLWEIA